ncbi:MAG TPA: glycosyltransferase [Rhabdochlamydiaceae bacterium]|nr:glycosyltransferase [Rhabdochlamydiaceae bacterium]
MTVPPLITTIIPTYRRPLQLKRAIRSVLAQTYAHLQVCVYDNASGDETASVVAQIAQKDPRVKYHCHSCNITATSNFEYGMRQVDTPFFSFLSDDDLLLPGFYETALAGFKDHPEAAFSAGGVIDMTDKGRFMAISKTTLQEKEVRIPPQGLFEMISNYINWTGILFRKEVIAAIGGLDPTIKPIDLDFVLKAAARFTYVVSQKPCAIFFHHPASYSGNCGLKLIWPGWLKIIENLKNVVAEAEKEKVESLLKSKMRDLLTYTAVQGVLRSKMDEMIPIADLLMDMPESKLKGKVMKFTAIFCKKHIFLQKSFCFFAGYSYKTLKFLKDYRLRKQYVSYVKLVKEFFKEKADKR